MQAGPLAKPPGNLYTQIDFSSRESWKPSRVKTKDASGACYGQPALAYRISTYTGTHIWHSLLSSDNHPFCWISMYKDSTMALQAAEVIIMFRYQNTLMGTKEKHGLEFLSEESQHQSYSEVSLSPRLNRLANSQHREAKLSSAIRTLHIGENWCSESLR